MSLVTSAATGSGIFQRAAKRWQPHVALLAGIIILTSVVRTNLRSQHAAELRGIGNKAREQRSLEIEAQWQARAYSNAAGEDFIDAFLAKIKWSSLELSDFQKAKLRSRLKELLLYFQDPRFDGYYRLKTERLHYLMALSPWGKTLVEISTSKDQGGEAPDPQKTLKAIWNKFHAEGGTGHLPRVSAVCLDSIDSAVTHTNSPDSLLRGTVRKGMTVAVEAANPGIRYTGDLPTSTPNPDRSAYLHISFLAKANGSDNAGPVYLSLCWLEQDQQWGLSRLIADQWVGIKTVF